MYQIWCLWCVSGITFIRYAKSRKIWIEWFTKQKYHTVRTVSKSNRKIAERDKIGTPNSQIRDCFISLFGTSTSIRKSDGVKLVLLVQTSPLSDKFRSCKCVSHVSKMQTYDNKQHLNKLYFNYVRTINMYLLKLVLPVRFLNNHHQVHTKSKDLVIKW